MLEAPENTLVGIRYAAEKGADAVEFDVDFTKDGHAILMHDATVDRTTDGSGRVGDFTLDEIKKLNALGDFKESDKYSFVQVPTLEETIQTCLEVGIKMFIEVKAYQDSVKVRKANPNILVVQNWITRHLSYNRDGTPTQSNWLILKLARSLDLLAQISVHSWLFWFLRFPLLITHHSEVSGFYVDRWKESYVSVIVYGIKTKLEFDYFSHLGCPVIVDNVGEMCSQ